ncbi:MAG: FAS1-like dehydratase domain-containing protein [Bacillota bacterium]
MVWNGKITDEELEKIRAIVGTERSGIKEQARYEVTADLIKQVARAIGDYNPIYLSEDYARNTRHGSLIAPPVILWCFEKGNVIEGFPGVRPVWRESSWEFYMPLKPGDRIVSRSFLASVDEYPPKPDGGRTVEQAYENVFTNQRGELVGRHTGRWIRKDPTPHTRGEAPPPRQNAQYTKDEIERIYADYAKEVRQGSESRYWDDVSIGDELPFVVKGPTTSISNALFEAALQGGPGFFSHGSSAMAYLEGNGDLEFNEQGIPEPAFAVHMSNSRCQKHLGLPGAFEVGLQRTTWLSHLLMNWVGDNGWIKRIRNDYTRFIIRGDTVWCHGKVSDKRVEDGDHVVELELWAINQLGETVCRGKALVSLPARAAFRA